jgi:hypothetical protein
MQSLGNMGNNACAGIDKDDRERLGQAAKALVDARGLIMMITDTVGHIMSGGVGSAAGFIQKKFGFDLTTKAEEIVEAVLWRTQSMAMIGMDAESDSQPWNWFHKLVAAASGASAGFFGAPGLIWDLPITTGTIMRSVADIARSFPGEQLSLDNTKRACIEVFAFGGPETEDDDADAGYWTTRAAVSHLTIEMLIKVVASRFGVVLTEKVLAQVVPVAGMVAGGVLNYAFIDYYQQMARVHFTVRDVERRTTDLSAVKACLSYHVREVRQPRKLRPKADAG